MDQRPAAAPDRSKRLRIPSNSPVLMAGLFFAWLGHRNKGPELAVVVPRSEPLRALGTTEFHMRMTLLTTVAAAALSLCAAAIAEASSGSSGSTGGSTTTSGSTGTSGTSGSGAGTSGTG